MSPLARIAVERHDGHVVAELSGEVDVTNVGAVGDELIAAVPNDAHSLVADLSRVTYLDSAAIELLFDLSRRLRRRRQQLRLVVPPGSPLLRVLELTEVAVAAPLHDTLAAALADQ